MKTHFLREEKLFLELEGSGKKNGVYDNTFTSICGDRDGNK